MCLCFFESIFAPHCWLDSMGIFLFWKTVPNYLLLSGLMVMPHLSSDVLDRTLSDCRYRCCPNPMRFFVHLVAFGITGVASVVPYSLLHGWSLAYVFCLRMLREHPDPKFQLEAARLSQTY